ncbi:MAG: YceI family protein, partial [Cyclobacteriaceae bacterium]
MSHRTILLGVIIVMAQHGAAQSWSFNEKESYVVFIAKNLGMKVSGKISGMKIASNYDGKNIKTTTFSGSIDVSTIDTQIQMRDNHLKSSDYFDVQKYPIIEFKSKEVVEEGAALKVIGNVIIKGITKEIEVVFTIQKNGGKHT